MSWDYGIFILKVSSAVKLEHFWFFQYTRWTGKVYETGNWEG